MKLGTGLHPRHWHRGTWLLLLALAVLVLLLTHRPTGGQALAMEPDPGTPADTSFDEGGSASKVVPLASGNGYVAEIVDSSYTVGPAEFFALDLPTQAPGARAVHLFGTVTTHGKKDIIVRLFRSADYDQWLKIKSGRKPEAFWTSRRSGNLTLDTDLPPGEPMVLLLDNGYSIRTPKKVSCQLQLRYERGSEAATAAAPPEATPKADSSSDNLPPPRSNADEEMPPPPPPPPSGY